MNDGALRSFDPLSWQGFRGLAGEQDLPPLIPACARKQQCFLSDQDMIRVLYCNV